MNLAEIMQQARELSVQERRELITLLSDSVQAEDHTQHSILELAGLGAEIWRNIDVENYINQLRDEWDERP
jgi:hypothetical protein